MRAPQPSTIPGDRVAPPVSAKAPPTPLLLLTGFLGSGKTSLLRSVLPLLKAVDDRPHVVLKDYANAALDSATLHDLAPGIIPMTGSCVCCDSLGDLVEELADLPLGNRDAVLVETNGTTDPLPLMKRLLLQPAMQRYRDVLLVALVDFKRWQRRSHNNELERMQIRPASHVLFTWLDAVDAVRQQTVRDEVSRLNPRARVVDAEALVAEVVRRVDGEAGNLPTGFSSLVPGLRKSESRLPALPGQTGASLDQRLFSPLRVHGCAFGEPCSSHDLAHRFAALQLEVPRQVPRERLLGWLDSLPASVLRAKGVVEFAGEPERYHFFRRVERSVSFQELPMIPTTHREMTRLMFGGFSRFFLVLALLWSANPLRAAHSDIVLSRANGALHVDNQVHDGDIRENDAAGNGTVWATDNPGFAGSGFHFNDEILFDITGPLQRWDGTNWSTANVGLEFMEFVEPGPFGDAIHSVTITRATTFAPGYLIAQTGTRGTLHTHFVFILRATHGVAPAVGAYSFPLTLRSPQYTAAPPVHLVFNNGLEDEAFNTAVAEFQARQDVQLTLRASGEALNLRVPTLEGFTYQPLSAPNPSGPWTNFGSALVGNGSVQDVPVALNPAPTFFRILRHSR